MLKDTVKTYVKSYALAALWPVVVNVGILWGVGAFSSAPHAAKFGAAIPGQPNYNYNYIRNDAAAGYIYVANGEGGTTLSGTIGNIDSGIPAVNLAGDCTGASNNVKCGKATGGTGVDGGDYRILARETDWLIDGGSGTISVRLPECLSADGGTCAETFAIPSGTAGDLDLIITFLQADGGINGGAAKYSCGVLNHAGTCVVYRACNATEIISYTDAGVDAAAATTPSVSGCNLSVASSCSAGMKQCRWETIVQYAATGTK